MQIKAGDGNHKVLDRYIDPKNDPGDSKWHDLSIDLSAYGEQQVELGLTTLLGPAGDTSYDWAGRADPLIAVSQPKMQSKAQTLRAMQRDEIKQRVLQIEPRFRSDQTTLLD